MKKFLKYFFVATIGCMFFASTAMANSVDGNNTITVTGRAERQITPDTAFISIGVVTQNEKVETARQENAQRIENIVSALAAYGISAKEISTANFDLRPVYSNTNDRRQIVAYALENVLTIKVKNIKNMGSIIDKAFAQGANRLDGVRFSAANADEIQKELLREAVQDGLVKAKIVASAGGRNLGTMLKADISGSGNVFPETRMLRTMNDAAGFSGSQVFVGNLVVAADVKLVYQLN